MQLAGYVENQARTYGARYVGILTDGTHWHLHRLVAGALVEVDVLDAATGDVDDLLIWLQSVLATAEHIPPSFGSVGDGVDNPMMESLWSSMQIELLNRKTWKTRLELGQRDLRVHRDLPQPPTTALRAGLPQPHRVQTTLGEPPNPDRQLATVTRTQTVGRSLECSRFS